MEDKKNPYHNTSEKIYRWSFYVIHIVIAFAFLIVYQQEKDSLLDVIKEVFKFTKDIYYLYVIPVGLKILGEHAPNIVSAFRGFPVPEEKFSDTKFDPNNIPHDAKRQE